MTSTLAGTQDDISRLRAISARLDILCPQRTRITETPEPCDSCGHDVCACDCC